MRVALALLLLTAAHQDAPLEGVLDLMEKRTEGLRDLSFTILNRTDRNTGITHSEICAVYVRGTGLRVRARTEGPKERPNPSWVPAASDLIYTPDRLRIIQEWDERSTAALSLLTFAIRSDDPALKSHDHLLLPTGLYPVRMVYDVPLVYYSVAPRLLFSYEPNLAYEGKRTEGAKTYHVLVSVPSPRDAKLPQPSYAVESRRKEFFVDAATGAVARIRWDLTYRWYSGGMASEQRSTFLIEPSGELKVTDALTIPESVKWTQIFEGRSVAGRGNTLAWSIGGLSVNAGREASEIQSDDEKADLYADAVNRGVDEYAARLKKDAGDAEAQVSLAVARGLEDPVFQIVRARPVPDKSDTASIVAALEKAVELRPKAETPAINLLSAFRAAGDANREKESLDRFEKSGKVGLRLGLRAVARLNSLGEVDRAARLLEGLAPRSPEERRRASVERLFVAAAKDDVSGWASLFAREAGKCPAVAEKVALVRGVELRAEALPEAARVKWTGEAASALFDQAIKDHPEEVAFRIARSSWLRGQGKTTAAAAELFEAAPRDSDLVGRALDILDPVDRSGRVVIGGGAAPEPAPLEAAEAARLLAAFEKVAVEDPRVAYQWGRTLSAQGKADDAARKFEAALEACRGQTVGKPLHAAALRVAFQLGCEKGPEGWRDRCVETILAIGKDSLAVSQDLLYNETRNPVVQAIIDLFSRKEWVRAYRLWATGQQLVGGTYFMWRYREVLKDEGATAIKSDVFKEEATEKYLELAEFFGNFRPNDSAEVLEKAREKAPKDTAVLERLAQTYTALGIGDKAAAVYGELLLSGPAERRPAIQLDLAQVFLNRRDTAKAKDALAKIDSKALDSSTVLRCAEFWAQVQEWDRAIEACRRAFELGLRPHLLLGRCHEQKQDYYEALRCYNRDAAEGSSSERNAMMAMRSMRSRSRGEEAEPSTGAAARERLLKKLGSDWLLKRFLEQKFEPLPAEEEKKVKGSLEKLSSDEVAERDLGFDELRAFGARAAPLLIPLLKSGDEEVKTRVRQLFSGWAEPK